MPHLVIPGRPKLIQLRSPVGPRRRIRQDRATPDTKGSSGPENYDPAAARSIPLRPAHTKPAAPRRGRTLRCAGPVGQPPTLARQLRRRLTQSRMGSDPRFLRRSGPSRPNMATDETRRRSQNCAGSRRYDSTSYENLAYFRKPRLAFVVLVALDNGDPVIALMDCKLGSLGECVVERRCDIIGPNDPYT